MLILMNAVLHIALILAVLRTIHIILMLAVTDIPIMHTKVELFAVLTIFVQ